MCAMAGAHKNRAGAGAMARNDIEAPVTDREGARRIDRQLTAGLFNHAGRRLAARALLAQFRNHRVRMMGTEAIAIDPRVARGEARINGLVYVLEEWLVDDAAADASLVRHDDRRVAGAVEQANGICGKGIKLEQIEPIEVAALFDDGAVAIEKHRRPHQAVALATRSIAVKTRAGSIPVMQR